MSKSERYPKSVLCRNDFEVEIRPLTIDEVEKEVEMFQTLEKRERAKLPNDLLDPNYVRRMKRLMEDGIVYSITAWHDEKVVAVLSLYRGRTNWVCHTGEVLVLTHPKYRRYKIATVLFDELIPLAESLDVEKLYVHLVEEQKAAIKLFKSIGFKREATLKDHIKDSYSRYHNLRIYAMDLQAAHKAMDELMSHFHDYSG